MSGAADPSRANLVAIVQSPEIIDASFSALDDP
jgi:hypothetical protein